MENGFSSSMSINFTDFPYEHNPKTDLEEDKAGSNMKQNNSFPSFTELNSSPPPPPHQFHQQPIWNMGDPNNGNSILTPFEVLSNYARNSNEREEILGNLLRNQSDLGGRKLSTEEVMRVAAERFIQISSQTGEDYSSICMHPYGGGGSDLFDLSMEDLKDLELAQVLLSTAEKIGENQYERASKLLSRCELMASSTGNPVERVVYYFAEALREKIDTHIGRKSNTSKISDEKIVDFEKRIVSGSSLEFLAYHQALPFMQAIQFAGMQTILEKVQYSKKVHLIDLQIRSGLQWTILMQALAARSSYPIKLLKMTVVGTTNKQAIEETCERLVSFAESLNLPFSFKVVFLSDVREIEMEQFGVELDESVIVYSQSALMLMLSRPDCLENLMTVIRRIKPALMVVSEIEANHNSPSFVKRFTEALFFHSAYFDGFEACMKRENQYRTMLEGMYFREGIRNVVATDGEKRVKRCVKIDVWRAFFARFGMVENELRESSLGQARMVVSLFGCEDSCTIEKSGKSMIVGWKGTPLHSLSIWMFS